MFKLQNEDIVHVWKINFEKKKGLKLSLLCTLWLKKRHPQEALHVLFFTHFKIRNHNDLAFFSLFYFH